MAEGGDLPEPQEATATPPPNHGSDAEKPSPVRLGDLATVAERVRLRNAVRAAYESKESDSGRIPEIAAELNVASQTVYRILGIRPPKPTRPRSEIPRETTKRDREIAEGKQWLEEMTRDGLSVEELAQRHGITVGRVRRLVNMAGGTKGIKEATDRTPDTELPPGRPQISTEPTLGQTERDPLTAHHDRVREAVNRIKEGRPGISYDDLVLELLKEFRPVQGDPTDQGYQARLRLAVSTMGKTLRELKLNY